MQATNAPFPPINHSKHEWLDCLVLVWLTNRPKQCVSEYNWFCFQCEWFIIILIRNCILLFYRKIHQKNANSNKLTHPSHEGNYLSWVWYLRCLPFRTLLPINELSSFVWLFMLNLVHIKTLSVKSLISN
jgi:hypothetical protein